MRLFSEHALERPSGNSVGGNAPLSTVPKLWHTHVCVKAILEPTGGKVKPGNKDAILATICGYGSEVGRDAF